MENWEIEFDKKYKNQSFLTQTELGPYYDLKVDYEDMKNFIKGQLTRREAEIYIVAVGCKLKGWDFNRYLLTLEEMLKVKKIIN
jgi:hypothetical protein